MQYMLVLSIKHFVCRNCIMLAQLVTIHISDVWDRGNSEVPYSPFCLRREAFIAPA